MIRKCCRYHYETWYQSVNKDLDLVGNAIARSVPVFEHAE